MYEQPVITKRSTRYGSNYWHVFSPKLQRMVHFFSDLEYEHWLLVEADQTVKRFCEQPVRIEGLYEGAKVSSIFDMWIERVDGSQSFIEVKYTQELDPRNQRSERSIRQTTIQRKWCVQNNFNYEIKTEKDIRVNQILLDNLRVLIPTIKNQLIPNEIDRHQILKAVGSHRMSIRHLRTELPHFLPSRLNETIFNMIYFGVFYSNIDQTLLGLDTEVWIHGSQENT
ncbi:TnsA endonuclease N-terminal domain-containing protein [Brevibacillus sp. Leaf182]|uniref:TnsA endonuclease N-terminal domain-containing protein n=1 Tax=Brevibacillus sp. Leaf182 TaxID=1736290 RepID=UPI0007001169|nr:TnsA endonuclease N-terminal domain-containing protein [Brevibacillus sp. Leaf182]RAT94016.1 S-layer protein [Brevibacillus sp. Leaf182]